MKSKLINVLKVTVTTALLLAMAIGVAMLPGCKKKSNENNVVDASVKETSADNAEPEIETEVVTEIGTKIEVATDEEGETYTEVVTEVVTVVVPITKPSETEPATQKLTVKPTQPATQKQTTAQTQPTAQKQTAAATQAPTQKQTTAAPTQPATQKQTTAPTQKPTVKPTEPVTQAPTQPAKPTTYTKKIDGIPYIVDTVKKKAYIEDWIMFELSLPGTVHLPYEVDGYVVDYWCKSTEDVSTIMGLTTTNLYVDERIENFLVICQSVTAKNIYWYNTNVDNWLPKVKNNKSNFSAYVFPDGSTVYLAVASTDLILDDSGDGTHTYYTLNELYNVYYPHKQLGTKGKIFVCKDGTFDFTK